MHDCVLICACIKRSGADVVCVTWKGDGLFLKVAVGGYAAVDSLFWIVKSAVYRYIQAAINANQGPTQVFTMWGKYWNDKRLDVIPDKCTNVSITNNQQKHIQLRLHFSQKSWSRQHCESFSCMGCYTAPLFWHDPSPFGRTWDLHRERIG